MEQSCPPFMISNRLAAPFPSSCRRMYRQYDLKSKIHKAKGEKNIRCLGQTDHPLYPFLMPFPVWLAFSAMAIVSDAASKGPLVTGSRGYTFEAK